MSEKAKTKAKKNKKGGKIRTFLWKNKRQRAKNCLCILMVFITLISVGLGYVSSKLDLISVDSENNNQQMDAQQIDKIYEDEEFDIIQAVSSASSYNDYIYKWANNGGELRSSKNVLNVLLVGVDGQDGLENGGRSDSIILVSLNKKTKKIYMTSFFRDTWTYMNIGGNDRYNKLNASYFHGGDDALIDTLERNFKIDIDYYVAVDFSSFTDIINALGGVTLEVEEYEANYINRTTVHTIDFGPSVTLDGYEALVYARIRKSDSDSDVSRTKRQRKVISAFIESAKGASLSQLNGALDMLFKYVRTDLTKMQILSYGTQALTNGWINYEIEQVNLSDPSIFRTGYIGNSSVVFVDFPAVAEIVQTKVYGDSNVKNEDGVKLFSMLSLRSDGHYVAR